MDKTTITKMTMAKASEADLRMALDLTGDLEALASGWMPTGVEGDRFDEDSREHCVRAMEHILSHVRSASLFRVVFGMTVLLNPKNLFVDPDADHLTYHPRATAPTATSTAVDDTPLETTYE